MTEEQLKEYSYWHTQYILAWMKLRVLIEKAKKKPLALPEHNPEKVNP